KKKKKIVSLLENINETDKKNCKSEKTKKNKRTNKKNSSNNNKISKSKRKKHIQKYSDSEYTENISSTSLFNKSKLSTYSSKNMTCSEKNENSEILCSDNYAEQLSSEMFLSDLTNMNTKIWGIRKKKKKKNNNDNSLVICKNTKENSYLLKKKKKIKSRPFGYNEKEFDKN
ncbi:hypothetical protein PBK173_000509700, partial [Plasmodium berghei]